MKHDTATVVVGVQQLFFLFVIPAYYIILPSCKAGPNHAPNPEPSSPTSNTLRALSGLAGSSAAGLGRRALLLLLLGQLDGRGARDGGGAQVGAVAALGGRVDDALVELARRGRGGERGGLLGLGGLVGARGQLGGQADGVGGVGVDADGLGRRGLLDWCSVGWCAWGWVEVPERWRNRRTCGSACWSG